MGLEFFKRRAQSAKNAPEAHVEGKSISRPLLLLPPFVHTTTPSPPRRLDWIPNPHAEIETDRRLLLQAPVTTTDNSTATTAATAPDVDLLGLAPTARPLRCQGHHHQYHSQHHQLQLQLHCHCAHDDHGTGGARRRHDAILDELLAEQMRAQRRLRARARAMRLCTPPRSGRPLLLLPPPPPPPPPFSPMVVMGDVSGAVLSEDALRAGTRVFVPAAEEDEDEDEDKDEATKVGNEGGRAAPAPLWCHPEALARLEGHHLTGDVELVEGGEEVEEEEPEICVVKNIVVIITGGARTVDITLPRTRQMS